MTDGTAQAIPYTYTDSIWKDRLTSFDGTSITYDTIGNPLNWIDGSALAWQKGRQLASYTKNGVATSFTYDADGIRRSKTTNGSKTEYFVYDGELRSITSGSNTMRFVYGNGLSSVIFNGTEYWYVFNAQGDVIGLINASGSYVVKYTYDAWGKIVSQTDSDLARLNPFRYRSYIYDEETGLYYCQTRYYDPTVGRWLNADGYLATDVSTIGHNMYAYCGNNTINLSDSYGLSSCYCLLRSSISVCLYCGRTKTPQDSIDKKTDVLSSGACSNSKSIPKENPFLNPDGSISLYDNQRDDEGGYNHSQILSLAYDEPSLSLEEVGIGASVSFITCGWEFENADISLFDFCVAEASASVTRTGGSMGVCASFWSPSISFKIWDIQVSFGVEVLSIGAKAALDMEKGANLSLAYGAGLDIAVLW